MARWSRAPHAASPTCGPAVILLVLAACTAPDSPTDTRPPRDSDDTAPPFPSGLLVIDDVAVVDADGRREGRAVLVRDGHVERVTEAGQEWPGDAVVFDGGGHTLIPGLVDSHVHLATPGTFAPVGDKLAVNLRATLAAGVTEVVDLGGPLSLFALRDAITRGDAVGPRIHAAGPFLTAVGSHPCETFPDPTLCTFVDASDAGAAAGTRVAEGADVLKVALADASFTPWGTTPRLDLDALDAIADAGLPVWAHIDEDDDVTDAIDHGVDVLAHPVFAAPMQADSLAAAARAQAVITTISAFANVNRREDLVAPDADIQADWDAADPDDYAPGFAEESARWTAHATANLVSLRDAGARVIPGSDAGYYFVPHGSALLDELDTLVTLGWTPLEALTAATVDARELLGSEGGRVEPGVPADLVLVGGDPSVDLSALRDVRQVWLGGRAWDPGADLLPSPVSGVCLEHADCAEGHGCDAFTHACGDACPVPYASANPCPEESWCMPADGVVTTAQGVCHVEAACDLYDQGCTPEHYGLACLPFDLDTNACWLGGDRQVGDRCTWDSAATACAPGLFCSRIDGRCYELCDPSAADTCSARRCEQQYAEGGEPWFGLCL